MLTNINLIIGIVVGSIVIIKFILKFFNRNTNVYTTIDGQKKYRKK